MPELWGKSLTIPSHFLQTLPLRLCPRTNSCSRWWDITDINQGGKKKPNSNFTSARHRNLNKNCWEDPHFPSNLEFFCNATLIFSTKLKYMMLKISKHFMHEVPWYLKLFSATPWRLMRLLITDGNGSGKWVAVEALGRGIICFCGPQS